MANKIEKPAQVKLSSVTTGGKRAVVKAAAVPAPKISIVTSDAETPPADTAHVVKLKTLVDAVVIKSGAKKKDAKDIIDATLAEIAAALGQGHSLSLPPLGTLRVVKSQDKGAAKMMVLRLRIGGGPEGLAPDSDDS